MKLASGFFRLQLKQPKVWKKLSAALVIAVLSVMLAQLLQTSQALEQWEYVTWSWRQRFLAKPSLFTKDIKVIFLDQASLDWGTRENNLSWPWPREIYQPLINFIQRGQPKAIVFDMMYTEPSEYGIEDDETFAQALAGSPVVMGIFLGRQTQQQTHWPAQQPASPVKLSNLVDWLQQQQDLQQPLLNAAFPVPVLAQKAKLLSPTNETPDKDGLFRRVTLLQVFDGQVLPSMGLGAYLLKQADKTLTRTEHGFLLNQQYIETDPFGRVTLKFRGNSGTHQHFNAAQIIQAELKLQAGEVSPIDPNIFKDSYVFFGASAPGLKDLRPTAMSADYTGVEVHATLLDNLLAQDTIKQVPQAAFMLLMLLMAFAAGAAIIYANRVTRLLLYLPFFIILPPSLAFAAYELNYWWTLVTNEIAVLLALVSGIIYNYATEGRQKRFIKAAFNQYLSGEVIEQILADPHRLELGGEKRELSIFFSDVQGFSTISERLTPEILVQLLNDYLTDMTDIIMEEGGTLDKYEGDAIIAFWNAPLTQPDHAIRVCRAILRCQRQLEKRREEFYQRTGAWMYARIGVHTGDVVVGNFGSKKRFDYSMLGDAANLASRLEGANKVFGIYNMISEVTWSQTQGEFLGREIGTIKVVGRNTPVTVFELLGFKGETLAPQMQQFGEGLALYKQGRLAEAAAIFSQLDEPAAKVYLKRCLKEKDNVPADWTGIWVLDEK